MVTHDEEQAVHWSCPCDDCKTRCMAVNEYDERCRERVTHQVVWAHTEVEGGHYDMFCEFHGVIWDNQVWIPNVGGCKAHGLPIRYVRLEQIS